MSRPPPATGKGQSSIMTDIAMTLLQAAGRQLIRLLSFPPVHQG